MKDNNFVNKHLTVLSGASGTLAIGGLDVMFMDKMGVVIVGDLESIKVIVKCGEAQLDLTQFTTLYFEDTSSSPNQGYLTIPFPINQLIITVVNPDEDTNVTYYGGSA